MKLLLTYFSLFSLLFLSSCGSDSDGANSGVVGEISELVGYDGPSVIDLSNMANFPFSGRCVGEEKIVLSGSIDEEIECQDGSWQRSVDLSLYPNGVFNITITTESGVAEFEVTKNTLSTDAEALFDFELADLGVDSRGAHNAASVNNVSVVVDSEQGSAASFNGSDSSIVLSDGNFLNDAFSERTVAFSFKADDFVANQVIYDEGGATNAFGIKIESGSLILATRVGGASGMESVSIDLAGREGQWIKVIASFNEGQLKLETTFETSLKLASYSEIPDHGDTGGLGMRLGSDAFDSSTESPFSGSLDHVAIFSKAFTDVEGKLFLNQNIEPVILNLETLGRVGSLFFENAADLGENSSGTASVVTNVVQGSDNERGSTAVFNASGSIELSDGSYFNEAFDVKTYALYFKTTDVFLSQTLIDEGGATNGIALSLENGYLMASARNGGSNSQSDLIADISGMDAEWIKVIVTFNKGDFSMRVNDEVIQRTTSFSEIPAHSDTGGIGRLFNSDASGLSGDRFFSGEMSKFSIYERELSLKEMIKY
jgi:hypothetical protein